MTCRFIALFPSYPASNTQVAKIGDSTGLFCRIQEQSDTATCEMIHFEDHPVRCPQWTPFGFRRIRIAVEERHFILAIGEIIYRAQRMQSASAMISASVTAGLSQSSSEKMESSFAGLYWTVSIVRPFLRVSAM